VPDWLQQGEGFGEAGPAMQIDSFMVRVAAFRSRALEFFPRASVALPTSIPDLDILAHTGKQLEGDLVDWAESMSGEWKCNKSTTPEATNKNADDDSYEGHRNSYTSHGHASLWLRQRALRLIINSIFIKFISVRMQHGTNHEHLLWKQERMRGNLDLISRELCGDISYFFSPGPSDLEPSLTLTAVVPLLRVPTRELTILPSLASILAWPLAVAVSTENVPEPQRRWLQRKLSVVADSLGDAILHDVGRRGAFIF
jgi:hypothetical protein